MINPECPRCRIPLKRKSNNSLRYYKCRSCEGFSINISTLKKVLKDLSKEIWFEASKVQQSSSTPCPYCFNGTYPIKATIEKEVEIDVCKSCHCIWLDKGEVDLKEEKTFSNEINHAIAKLKNQNIKEQFSGTVNLSGGKWLFSILHLPVEKKEDLLNRLPILTWILIACCLGLSSYALSNMTFFEIMQFNPKSDSTNWLMTGFTSFFVHVGVTHLLGNMYYLWMFGDNVEDELGHIKYLLMLVIAMYVSSWGYGYFVAMRDSSLPMRPLVGASGGLASIMSYYLLRFPKRKFVLRFFYVVTFAVPAWAFIGFYILLDVFGTFRQFVVLADVSYVSHTAGAIVGAIFAFYEYKQDSYIYPS